MFAVVGKWIWPEGLILGSLIGLGLSLYVVAWNSTWGVEHSIIVAGVLTVASSALMVTIGSAVRRRNLREPSVWSIAVVASSFLATCVALVASHQAPDPGWARHIAATPGSDGVLWQVQTTLLSVGFAGLAIAAQLFAETPLAIGASRGRVLQHIRAAWFVSVGLAANLLIAAETIWLPSNIGITVVAACWFLPTLVLLVISTLKLMSLFGRPSQLDEVVRVALVETLAHRLDDASRKYADARLELDALSRSEPSLGDLGHAVTKLRVPVPRAGEVIKTIKPHVIRRAMASLAPQATGVRVGANVAGDLYVPAEINVDVEPGDRTRLGETAFRVTSVHHLSDRTRDQFVRILQSSIEFEAPGSVTPDEETDRDIANLKDIIGTSLRTGAFGTAQRALDLLGHVVREVWLTRPESLGSSRRSSFTRRDWLFRSIGEVEQDVLLSRRSAGLFVDQAMTRALEAPRTGSPEYVDECLRSFVRLWADVLQDGGPDFRSVPSRITTCVQNLAAFAFATVDEREDFQARATWALVELVKSALDAKDLGAARLAAEELDGLFQHSRSGGIERDHVRAGQLILSGWLRYLSDRQDERDPADEQFASLVTPRGTWSEILTARGLAERGAAPFSRWDWWEMETTSSIRAQVLVLSEFVDRAELAALASSRGPLPPATDQETASEYGRLLRLLDEGGRELSSGESGLRKRLEDETKKWKVAENERLALESLSDDKLAILESALRETLAEERRLANEIPVVAEAPGVADDSRPILGMNFRVPRHYLVEQIFNQTYADPAELGRLIARGFSDGEDRKIIEELRGHTKKTLEPKVHTIRQQIEALGEEAGNYVLITPYGGLFELEDWYSSEFRELLTQVTHVETAVLENEAILFDRRGTVHACRRPEEKAGLHPVSGTQIALGLFEDVGGEAEPQVRIETGEYFVVWGHVDSAVTRFADDLLDAESSDG